MQSREAYDLLVVSDLHLGEGRGAGTGFLSPHEDFLFDREFADFLDHHLEDARWRKRRWKLVINGDFVDFLQVVSSPAQPEGLDFDPLYGLGCGEAESVWKLGSIARGHRQLFDALARFASRHKIIIVVGNHDIEFWYPAVQNALVEELQKRAAENIAGNVTFCSWFYLEDRVYCEHGHQYDATNSFAFQLDPRLPRTVPPARQDHVELPLGSLFVRYLFNRVEAGSPHADNVKPATRFVGWFLRNHPLRALRFLLGDGREMLRRVRRAWRVAPPSSYLHRQQRHQRRMATLARSLARDEPDLEFWRSRLERLDDLREDPLLRQPARGRRRLLRILTGPVVLPLSGLLLSLVWISGLLYLLWLWTSPLAPQLLARPLQVIVEQAFLWLPAGLWELFRWLFLLQTLAFLIWELRRRRRSESDLHKSRFRHKAKRIQELVEARCVVMGHTHDPDLFRLTDGAEYFNTGTWTKVFSEEEELYREEKELVFLRLLRSGSGEWSALLLKWDQGVSGGRLVHLFGTRNKP